MHIRFFAAALAALAAAACAPAGEDVDAAASLKGVADGYLEAATAFNPLTVYYALTDVMTPDHAAMPDITPEAIAGFNAVEDAYLTDLLKIDPAALTARGDWVTYQSLKELLEANVGLRQCHQEWWSVSHMTGWQTGMSDIASRQPTASEDERAAALMRWSKLPGFIAQDRANLETGLAEGYSAPKSVVDRVIAQLTAIVDAPIDDNPYFVFAADAAEFPAFQADARALFETAVNPALAAYRDFLQDVYRPAARDEISISALPNGAQCYEAMLRSYHSAEIGAQRTFDRGKAAVEANTRGAVERGEALVHASDLATILARVKEDPANRFESEQEVVDFTRALVPQAKEKVARFFSRLPAQELVVEPYADYLKGTGQPSRYEPNPAGDAPAIYRIDTDDWADDTRGGAEIVAVHEGWPGHHLQIATAFGIEGLHPVTRLASSTAFIEGWARYAEALAEEAGIYESGFGEITRRAWPARGMVVDTGVHAFGWTNEQATAFVRQSGRFQDDAALDLLDRIAVIPGQLTAYDTGGLEIMALRKEAEERLGADFDIREFHDRILENGALPLGALRQHVEAWIAEKAAP